MRQIQLLTLILTAFMIAQLLVIVPARGQENDDREIRDVHLNLKANDVLSPETNPDVEAEPEKKRVMADYDQKPLFPWTRENRRQVDAGTWATRTITGAMTIEAGTFTFNVWSQEYDSGFNGSPDWEFYLYHNDEQIAHASVSNAESSKDRPVEVRANGNIASNRDVQPGDTLKINIKYTAWEDCDIYFNTMEYDSGGTGRMDSIQILWARGTTEIRFFDTFAIDWQTRGKYFCRVETDGDLWYGDVNTRTREGNDYEDPQGRTYTTTILSFQNLDIPPGTETMVTVTYGPPESGSDGWSFSYVYREPTPPTADAGPDQTVDEGARVRFDGSASTDEVGIENYSWTFNDGVSDVRLSGVGPSHTFNVPGVYVVTLNVTNQGDGWDTDTMIVTVRDVTPPSAYAGQDQTVEENVRVTFDGTASTDNVGIVNYTWTFHDGTGNVTLYGISPTHTFTVPGVHIVTLNVTDAAGRNDTDTMTVMVLAPEVIFQSVVLSPERPKDGDTVSLTATLKNTGEATARSVEVTVKIEGAVITTLAFGDIAAGETVTRDHAWTVLTGTYTLEVELSYTGGEDTHTQTLEVRKKGSDSPGFEVLGAFMAVGLAVVLFGKRRG